MKLLFLQTVTTLPKNRKELSVDFAGAKVIRVDVEQLSFQPLNLTFNETVNNDAAHNFTQSDDVKASYTLASFAGQKVLFDASPDEVRSLLLESYVAYKAKSAEALEKLSMSKDDMSKKALVGLSKPGM